MTKHHDAFFDHYAGRYVAQTKYPIVEKRKGAVYVQKEADGESREVINFGAACSEVFGSGKQLLKITKPARDLEERVVKQWQDNDAYHEVLSLHTSSGVTTALETFINELENNLYFDKLLYKDWFVSLQLEGASAVWGAIDILLQLRYEDNSKLCVDPDWKVAVAELSYHGPVATSLGASLRKSPPLGMHSRQITYPVPSSLTKIEGETTETLNERARKSFDDFLQLHGKNIEILIVEPQRGSSACAEPWDRKTLHYYIQQARSHGISILADEIMCGLGRHGTGEIFLSNSWELDVDAVTFGKAIAGGCGDVLSGVLVREGAKRLSVSKRTSFQSHTYAGSSARALLTATEVLKEVPLWYNEIAKIGDICHRIFSEEFKSNSNIVINGMGAMWGMMFNHADIKERGRAFQVLKEGCKTLNVKPYFIDRTFGFMITPVYDIPIDVLTEGCMRLVSATKLALSS